MIITTKTAGTDPRHTTPRLRTAVRSLVLAQAVALLAVGAVHAQTLQVGGYDVPTGKARSPLFGAQPFSQQMLDFEEIGPEPIPGTTAQAGKLPPLPAKRSGSGSGLSVLGFGLGGGGGPVAMPQPVDCQSGPDTLDIDAFLSSAQATLAPLPTRLSNTTGPNPWADMISQCVRPLGRTYMEGRPPGEWFSHQRWDEFPPRAFAVTMQTGARPNGGIRDIEQRHKYQLGEFGPGGLYYNTTGLPGFDGTTRGITIRLHPNMPVQDKNSVWTFDGTLPPKLLMTRIGEPLLFRHYNGLPIDASANNGFGANTISTHMHNGHNPAESDGFPHVFFFPGQFYDYVWPMILARYDSVNTNATDIRAGAPDGNGGITKVRGDFRETPSTLWFHDHMLDFTAQNVYKANAAAVNLYSAIDRGNEGLDCNYKYTGAEADLHPNLCLPSGTASDWGNRDYDHNILIADKATDANGQLWFNTTNLDGMLGDIITVNWLYKPYMQVRARKYRFRILNGSVSRYYKTALVDERGNPVPFYMVGNDGNIMEHAIPFDGRFGTQTGILPTQAIAERYDIIIDFSKFAPGSKLYFVNLMEHKSGKGPEPRPVDLAAAFNGTYQGDPVVGKFLEFRVNAYSGTDTSMNPEDYIPGKRKMIIRNPITPAQVASATARTFEFGRSGGTDKLPWTVKTDGGPGLNIDIRRVSAEPTKGAAIEKWTLINGGNGWSHPVHIHFEEGHIQSRDGAAPPIWEQYARKDVFRIGPEVDSSRNVVIAYRFGEFNGTYVEHCHNTQHEDHAMMIRWDIKNPGQKIVVPTPFPDWDGVYYQPSFTALSADTDADYVPDDRDNCKVRPNMNQEDADKDGYGNSCDTDVTGDLITNAADEAIVKRSWMLSTGNPSFCARCDFNSDGTINQSDLDILKSYWLLPPGPSAGKP